MNNTKIELQIADIAPSGSTSGAYAMVLGEVDGMRRLPIVIGGAEAQAIAIELEKMSGSIKLVIPYSTLEPIKSKLSVGFQNEQLEVDHIWINRIKAQLINTYLNISKTSLEGKSMENYFRPPNLIIIWKWII